jgi:hypothetical protein
MKDLRVVLRQKEEEMRQLKIHIYCLKIAIPLLIEPGDELPPAPPASPDGIFSGR